MAKIITSVLKIRETISFASSVVGSATDVYIHFQTVSGYKLRRYIRYCKFICMSYGGNSGRTEEEWRQIGDEDTWNRLIGIYPIMVNPDDVAPPPLWLIGLDESETKS